MRKLIFGCGYLGTSVARRWLEEGCQVAAVTRSAERAGQLAAAGIQPIIDDVLRPANLARLDNYQTILYAIGYDRQSTASMRDVYVLGLRNIIELANRGRSLPERFIYISSTGVYGDSDGAVINEQSECRPQRAGGRVCLDAERELTTSRLGKQAIILRMAGIYGPGRVPRQRELLAGTALQVPQDGSLNLIHVDDGAAVVLAAERFASRPAMYNVSDGEPVERREYFRFMAQLLGAPPPQFQQPSPDTPAAERAQSNKRIDNSKMLRELHVQLQYPSYREGLAAILV